MTSSCVLTSSNGPQLQTALRSAAAAACHNMMETEA